MLTLKSLSFIAGGRFVERQTIDFTRLGPLAQVIALNENTGGSSGGGKSTIFKLLDFLLGLNQIPAGVLQSRLTDETLDVEGLFDWDGLPVRIQRGKKYLIDVNGDITTGNAKKTDELLAKILGMDDKLFRKILHKRQKEGGFFLKMTGGEVHKFMIVCLSQEAEAAKIITLDLEIAKWNKKITELQSSLQSATTGLTATNNAISLAFEPKCTVDQSIVDNLWAKQEENRGLLEGLKENNKRELKELQAQKPAVNFAPFDRTKILELEKATAQRLKEISALENAEKDSKRVAETAEKDRQRAASQAVMEASYSIQALKAKVALGLKAQTEAEDLAAQITKLRQSICHFCERGGWLTDTAKAKEEQLMARLRELKTIVVDGKKAESGIPELESGFLAIKEAVAARPLPLSALLDHSMTVRALKASNELEEQILKVLRGEERTHNDTVSKENQAILVAFALKENTLRSAHSAVEMGVQEIFAKSQSDYNSAANEWKNYKAALAKFQESAVQMQTHKKGYEDKMASVALELLFCSEQLELAIESKKEIKSYLSASFEDALESIGDMATNLIRGIPNMATATIQFEGLKETKDGKIKEEINAVLHMDGELSIPIKSLSGGEESSTDLAIDLAVINFIEERTGKGINLMILDEPFDGLDFECSSNALEMLKNSNLGKTILIVDHNPVLKEQIDSKITVVRSGLTSRIVQ